MATVPEGKTVYIGKREYRTGDELPSWYKLPGEPKPKKSSGRPKKQEESDAGLESFGSADE